MKIGFILNSLLLTGSVLLAAAVPPQAAPVNQYVDPGTCSHCHNQIYESYRRTSMGRSFFQPAPANTIEDYKSSNEFYHRSSDTHYSMILRDGQYYVDIKLGRNGEALQKL